MLTTPLGVLSFQDHPDNLTGKSLAMKSPICGVLLFAILLTFSLDGYSQVYAVDPTFQVGTGFGDGMSGYGVSSIAVQPDDKILVAGNFFSYDDEPARFLVRLNEDGTLDNTFTLQGNGFDGPATLLQLQSDGKIVVAGRFTKYNDVTRKGILRLNTDGTLDNTFDAGEEFKPLPFMDGVISSLLIQPDGKILVGTSYTGDGQSPVFYVKRLLPAGELDPSFTTANFKSNNSGRDIFALAVQPDNKILVGGFFDIVNNVAKSGTCRLNSDGTLDSAFPEDPQQYPTRVFALDGDGNIYRGTPLGLTKITSSGANDESFQASDDFIGIVALAIQDDKLIVAKLSGLIRLKLNGEPDDAPFSFLTDNVIFTIGLQSDNRILFGGSFENINNDTPSKRIARLGLFDGQYVIFNSIPKKTFGDEPFDIHAESSESLPVTFSSDNTSVATVDGNTVTIVGAGIANIKATAVGNEEFATAFTTRKLTVEKAANEITFEEITAKSIADGSFDAEATSTSELPVKFTSTSDKVSILNNTVTFLKPGPVTITAEQTGNDNYEAAEPKEQTFCINPEKPIISVTLNGATSAVLTSSNDAGNQWMNGNESIDGATGKSFEATESGNYFVITMIEDCASPLSEGQVVTVTGLEDLITPGLKILQNPVRTHVAIEVSGTTDEEVMVEIVDMLGRSVTSKLVRTNQPSTIDIAHTSNGIYIVRSFTQRVRILKSN